MTAEHEQSKIAVPCSGNIFAGNEKGHIFVIEDGDTRETLGYATPGEVEEDLKSGRLSERFVTSHSICPPCAAGAFGNISLEGLEKRIPEFSQNIRQYQDFLKDHSS